MMLVAGYYSGPPETADHSNLTTVDAWDVTPYYRERLVSELRAAQAVGLKAILNLHRVFWHTEWDNSDDTAVDQALRWTLRVDIGALDALDDTLAREGLWPTVLGLTAGDEPLTRFVQSGRNLTQGLADVRWVYGYLKARWPSRYRVLIVSAKEIMPGYLESWPERHGVDIDVIGFDVYLDAYPFGGTDNGSYQAILARTKVLFPGKPILLVPDGWIGDGETPAAKRQRITDIYRIAQADPHVLGWLIYSWNNGRHFAHDTPWLVDHYRSLTGGIGKIR